MLVTIPFAITDANLNSCSLPENDYAVWATSTSYSVGDNVISTTTHSVYECLVAHTSGASTNPDTDTSDPPNWLRISATNIWRAFDNIISDPTIGDSVTETYSLNGFTQPANGVTCLGLDGISVQLVVTDPNDGEVFDETVSLIDNSMIVDAYTYAFDPVRYRTEAIFSGIPPYAAATFDLTFTAASGEVPEIGEIVLGREYQIGETLFGTTVSIEDYSVKERDQWGNAIITERPFAKLIDFDFVVRTEQIRRAATLLETVRATPAVFNAGTDTEQYGVTVYGFYRGWSITTGATISDATMEVEGLV
jgi:hypothetical protein